MPDPKKKPRSDFFRHSEDDSEGSGSLSRYIAKHLEARKAERSGTFQANTEAPKRPSKQEMFQQNDTRNPNKEGLTLHALDSQLAGKHLEQYLPTPSTRLHLIRKRLVGEIETLQKALEQYQHLSGPEYQEKTQAIKDRIQTLQTKLTSVDHKISGMNPFHKAFHTVQQMIGPNTPNNPMAHWKLILSPQYKETQEIADMSDNLSMLHDLLSSQLHDPSFTPDQLGRLVSEYDTNMKKVEQLIDKLEQRQSPREKLNNKLNQFYRRLYHWHDTKR